MSRSWKPAHNPTFGRTSPSVMSTYACFSFRLTAKWKLFQPVGALCRKPCRLAECRLAEFRYGCRDLDLAERGAAGEHKVADRLTAFRDRNGSQRGAVCKCGSRGTCFKIKNGKPDDF